MREKWVYLGYGLNGVQGLLEMRCPPSLCAQKPGGPMRAVAMLFCLVLVVFSLSQTQATIIHTPGGSSTVQGRISGAASSDAIVTFFVHNHMDHADTIDLKILDELGWNINPTSCELILTSGEMDCVDLTVSIPYVPVGITDKLWATAVSRADPGTRDSASFTVTCHALAQGVEVTAGGNETGYADSSVLVTFYVQNVGTVIDSYSVDISDIEDWDIDPLHLDLVLEPAEAESLDFIVSIPYVPLGTSNLVGLVAVSKSNPSVFDVAGLTVTCTAFKEAVSVTAGDDQAGPTVSEIEVTFYVENTGIVSETYDLDITDPLSWVTSPLHYELTLDPGELDSLQLLAFIPDVPVETATQVRLDALSQANPYVGDSDSLTITCDNYRISITEIADVPNDQGRQVRAQWLSFTDSDSSLKHFTIFRRIDTLLTTRPSEWNASEITESVKGLVYPPGEWEVVSTIPAYGETLYATVVPTLKDSSISGGIYYSVFFVRAGTDNPYVYYDSPIDSGYSLDNLSPSPPTGLFASHEPAVTRLSWNSTLAPDFDYYTVYRDTLSGFAPGSGTILSYTIDTSFIDSTAQVGRAYYYLTSATDFSGNESNPSNEAMGIRYITGDMNADGLVNPEDVVLLLNYLFRNGPPPPPLEAGDFNCDGEVSPPDVVVMLNYLFRGGPPASC